MRNRLLWAWYGVLATLAGVGAAHLVAAFLDPAASPALAVGSTVIDLTPTPARGWAIRTFGDQDKVVLVGSVMAGVLALAAAAGVLARRRLAYGAALLVPLVTVAVGSRPQSAVTDLVPSAVAALVAVAALAWLAQEQADVPAQRGGRRGVLIAMGVLVAGAVVTGVAGRWVSQLRLRPEAVDLPAPCGHACHRGSSG